MNLHQVIQNPVVSEKTMYAEADGKYTFKVNMGANRMQVREAVQALYDVEVASVRILVMPAKTRRRGNRVFIRSPKWKKAVVTLAEGETINVYEGN